MSWGGGLTEGVSVLIVPIVPNLWPRRLDSQVFGAGAMMDTKVMDIGPARVAEKFLRCATRTGTCLANVEEQLEWLL